MHEQDRNARVRATIEEELGQLRHSAHLPASALEEMAARLTRALAPYLAPAEALAENRAA